MQWELQPGWQRKYKVVVTDVYDFTTPGTYYLAAKWFFHHSDETWAEVVSGTMTFRVTAGGPAGAPKPSSATGPAPSVESRGTANASNGNTTPKPLGQVATNPLAPTNETRAASGQADTVNALTANAAPETDRSTKQLASEDEIADGNQMSRLLLLACIPIIGVIAFLIFRAARKRV
jgi:hypothetical protein